MEQNKRSCRVDGAGEILAAKPRTIWRWVKTKPGFPQPIRLSARHTVFRVDELVAWRDAQAKGVAQ